MYHSIALRADGTIVAWGDNGYGQCNVPAGNGYGVIAAGSLHNLAVQYGQQTNPVVCWGDNRFGQCIPPPPDEYTNVAAGDGFSTVATDVGKVYAWGDDTYGQTNVPSPNNYDLISSGTRHTLATTYGKLAAWGDNSYGECNVPAGDDYIAISAGEGYSVAGHADHSLVIFGANPYGVQDIPGTNAFSAFDANFGHIVAVRTNGKLAAWGQNDYGQCNVPGGYGYFAVAAGYDHSVALKETTSTDLKANFSAVPVRGNAPLGVAFVSSSGGSPDTFLYDFGDGSTSGDPDPYHLYSSPGEYTVALTVTGNNSTDTMTRTDHITVLAPLAGKTTLFHLNTVPYGAIVYVDGIAVGMTRKAAGNLFKAADGMHSIRVAKEGYQEWNGTFEAEWPKLAFFDIRLIPL
jgi:PKD repeat protein